MPGLRIGRSGAVLEALIPAILEQKVTGTEARRAYRGIIARWGEAAPGPFGLRLMPAPEVLARLPYEAFHPIGLERRRADLVRAVALRATRFEEIVDLPLPDAYRRLTALPGLGPWTAAEVAFRALGDPDAVSIGDFHLPNLVAYALAGEQRATDARMLELLAPYRGQRGRVIRLLEASGIRPPARGPRMAIRSIVGDLNSTRSPGPARGTRASRAVGRVGWGVRRDRRRGVGVSRVVRPARPSGAIGPGSTRPRADPPIAWLAVCRSVS